MPAMMLNKTRVAAAALSISAAAGTAWIASEGDGPKSVGKTGEVLLHPYVPTQWNDNHTHGFDGSTSYAGDHAHGVGSDYRVALTGGGWSGWAAGNDGRNMSFVAGGHSRSVSGAISYGGVHEHNLSITSSGGDEARMKSVTGAWLMRVK
jgi:hypothetical protein